MGLTVENFYQQHQQQQKQHELELESIRVSAKAPAQMVGGAVCVSSGQAQLSKMLEEFQLAEDAEKLAKTAGIEKRGDLAFLDDGMIKELPLTPVCKAKLKRMLRSFCELPP